jgi:hypothetical protein
MVGAIMLGKLILRIRGVSLGGKILHSPGKVLSKRGSVDQEICVDCLERFGARGEPRVGITLVAITVLSYESFPFVLDLSQTWELIDLLEDALDCDISDSRGEMILSQKAVSKSKIIVSPGTNASGGYDAAVIKVTFWTGSFLGFQSQPVVLRYSKAREWVRMLEEAVEFFAPDETPAPLEPDQIR